MVKNLRGGNNKNVARKKVISNSSSTSHFTTYSSNPLEMYAVVTKIDGNTCHARCIDNVVRLCIIRGNFKGRGKRDNLIVIGSWLLVGLRDWQSIKPNKMSKCDLMEVYNEHDKNQLKSRFPDLHWENLNVLAIGERKAQPNDLNLKFMDFQEEEYETLVQKNTQKTVIAFDDDTTENEFINIDDI
jgi:hypothetical protein